MNSGMVAVFVVIVILDTVEYRSSLIEVFDSSER